MRLLQINLNRCREAHDLLESTCGQQEIDICLVTEPNKARVTGVRWKIDDEKDAAIWLNDEREASGRHGGGKGFAWAEVAGVLYYSCYFSPNRSLEDFQCFLDEVGVSLDHANSDKVIITGDFNAASVVWGSADTCGRGAAVLDWLAQRDLHVMNDGQIPTFSRRGRNGVQESYLDLTICTGQMVGRISNWCVRGDWESLSDHRFIDFEVRTDSVSTDGLPALPRPRWPARKLDKDALTAAIVSACQETHDPNEGDIVRILQSACDMACRRVHPLSRRRKPQYWWTPDIAESRRRCLRARRVCTRARGRATDEQLDDYRGARKNLRDLIRRTKEAKWRELCDEIEYDPWGKGYKIVMRKLGGALPKLPEELVKEIVRDLFPRCQPETERERIEVHEFPQLTLQEIYDAGERIKIGKAPGPDGIPPEATKCLLRECPHAFRIVADKLLKEGRFPAEWKTARLVLIPKPGKPAGTPSAYRPLCLLDTAGKAMEAVLAGRLVAEMEANGALSENQYGFRKGRSTLTALERVMEVAEGERARTLKTRGLCLVVLLDVKNAFNSMSWDVILDAMRAKGISPCLRRMIASYLADRKILLGESGTYEVMAGVPQGSILGPILWNLAYDGVLRLEMPQGVRSIAYADDLALVITAKREPDLEDAANRALDNVATWMSKHHLRLAPEKTEAIVMVGRKRFRDIEISLSGHRIIPQKEVKYLGVRLDQRMTGTAHVRYVTGKALKAATSLSRLMPRTGGAGEQRRRLLATVADSIVLYAAPVWERAMRFKRNRALLRSTQRVMALRTCRAYRTVSTRAALVLARSIPWDLMVRERAELRHDPALKPDEAREKTLERWQQEWIAAGGPGEWTRRLIGDLTRWYGREHGEVSYYLTQALTGHGCFQAYLFKRRRALSPTCVLCDTGEEDDVSHTLERCPLFRAERAGIERKLERPFSIDTMAMNMLESDAVWEAISLYVRSVLRRKEELERERQQKASPP